ncbi:uncharacterized protein [Nicotiana sylvestris]|uniref:uncharacterized protein n=1 Tax=Nicotiana sylvestris TaxID=4096 RepID=UPI00388CEB02
MDEEDAEKTAFTTPWGTYYYRVMPFGLKNTETTYMRPKTAIFHDMMHQEIEVYVDDVIIKSRTQGDHVRDLRKFFEQLHKYDLKLNPAKCAFGVLSGKLLGIHSQSEGHRVTPNKDKVYSRFASSKNQERGYEPVGRLNYISRFIAQLTSTCEPIFKLSKKDVASKWTDECQEAFDKIKEYLSNPPDLVPPETGRPLFLYLTVLENSFGCVLGQHDVTGKREQAIYYLSKKITSYEAKYTLLERTCCALTWVAQKLRHYLLAYTTYLITRLDPLKYIFQKPMPTGRLAKWQILLTEFDIVYVTRTTMKAQTLADHLAENPVDDEYQPLSTYFPNEEVNSVEITSEDTNAWKMFFDGDVNAKGVGIGAILISPTGQHNPATARLQFFCTNNIAEYEAYIMGMNIAIYQNVEELLIMGDSDLIIRQAQGKWETRDVKLIPYRQHVEDLSRRFKSVEFSQEEHAGHLRVVLQRLTEEKLYAKFSKCEFWLSSVAFLGRVMSSESIQVDPMKIEAGFSSIASPLTKLAQKGAPFRWSDECEEGRVITYALRQLKTHEKNCPLHDLKLAAIIRALKIWRHYLYGVHCEIHIDHRSLQHLFKKKDLNLLPQRWLELLKDYNITNLYHPGKANMVANELSHWAESLGSLAYLSAAERPLALDVQALAGQRVRLDILEPSRVLACVVSRSSLYDCIREHQYDDPHLLVFQDRARRGDAKDVTIGDDGVMRMQGRICVPNGRLRTTQSRQKSYADRKVRDVSYMVGEKVLQKVSPMKGLMRFGKKGKLSPRFIGPFEVLHRIGEVAYELALLHSLSGVHPGISYFYAPKVYW